MSQTNIEEYFVYVKIDFDYFSLKLNSDELDVIIDSYKRGEHKFTISGEKYDFRDPLKVKIYKIIDFKRFQTYVHSHIRDLINKGLIKSKKSKKRTYTQEFFGFALKNWGECIKDVTSDIIGNMNYGEFKSIVNSKPDYVSQNRIKELGQISNNKHDLTKLIRLCEELNSNWYNENYISVGALIRILKDHVAPIFSYQNFNEVANNYSSAGKSFKKSMQTLQNTSKDISDRLIHNQIKPKTSLPSDAQVNFSQDLDVLLEEIVRILK